MVHIRLAPLVESQPPPQPYCLFQVGVFGLSPQFTDVVTQLFDLGISVLRRNLNVLVKPVRDLLDGLVKQNAPKDLTALL